MRKILGLVMSLLIVFSTVSTVLAEESNECLLCHGTKVFECPENDCTKGNFCLTCMDYSWTGYSGICSTCRGTGKQNIMGTLMLCSSCIGSGKGTPDYRRCEKCGSALVCDDCLGTHSIACPLCDKQSYVEFVYNQTMRNVQQAIGNEFTFCGSIVETSEVSTINHSSLLKIDYSVSETVHIPVNVIYIPIKGATTEKPLIGDTVRVYATLFSVDEKNDSMPTFYSRCIDIDGLQPTTYDMKHDDSSWLNYVAETLGLTADTSSVDSFCDELSASGFIPPNATESIKAMLEQCSNKEEFLEAFTIALATGDF